ncbi:chromate transporter [Chromohalobacter israelensis]|uniref:Chromate transporter n=1 Tax=Chromohalobacter israelensis (strain ATCC BAA-138 / DSM 3043 / CIP 106854 / NCIMB 13768 / 1H11) TaxID=290398 RepID=Q1QWR5_CHRI1|nr:chromate transporter [Chromohalobacter salexigens]ABE59093.1 Chromate transporter [Chromohalobacter salexigens DSM 3043]
MIYWHLFLAFFVPNIIGYGGGPAIIPLIETEVVDRYGWMSAQQFAEVLALGNALPSPIATKMAGYIGFEVAGVLGATVAVLATVVPTLLLMLGALGLLYRFRDSPRIKRMSQWVRPVIALLMAELTFGFFSEGLAGPGLVHTLLIAAVAAVALIRLRIHPAFVVLGALVYGGLFLG